MNDTVLVIEDDGELRQFLCSTLEANGFRALEADSATHAIEAFAQVKPIAILLDLGLPDRDGLDVLRDLRATSQVPVIVLSARQTDDDKVTALDAGADDYLTKPFSTNELLARVRVARRHAAGKAANEAVIVVGPLRIDQERHEVSMDSNGVKLTPIEFRLLVQLARHAGKVMTHRQLLEEVWGPGKEGETHYLRVHMAALRRKLEQDPARPRWLTTEPGIGYRLRDQ